MSSTTADLIDEKNDMVMSDSSVESQLSKDNISTEPSPEERALADSARRKLDLVLIPVVTMFYLLSYLDRTNIGNARVAGMQKALNLTDHQFQIAVTLLYVPYICTELPANIILKRVGPQRVMPTILTIWGIIVTFHGFVSNYSGLLAARFFLGLMEGPMFPGIVLYLSSFYTRKQLGLRIAYFFAAASLAGAFSGLLAAAITNMDGVGGKGAWQWIFILEGLFTFLFGVASYFLVPASPATVRLLTEEEKDAVSRELERDRPPLGVDDTFNPREIFRSILSPHVLLLFVIFFCGGAIFFGLSIFLPSVIRQMGFTPLQSQLLSVGPFGASFFVSVATAWLSDRLNRRGVVVIPLSAMCVAGFSLFYASNDVWIRYGSFFLIICGVFPASPLAAAWVSNNSEPYYRRATAIAWGFMGTNFGGILSTWRFPTKEGPRFEKTTIMNISFAVLMVVGSLTNMALLTWMQKRKEQNREKILAPYATEKQPDGGERAWLELGDKHPDFKYTL